jgi:hypothetical protein
MTTPTPPPSDVDIRLALADDLRRMGLMGDGDGYPPVYEDRSTYEDPAVRAAIRDELRRGAR